MRWNYIIAGLMALIWCLSWINTFVLYLLVAVICIMVILQQNAIERLRAGQEEPEEEPEILPNGRKYL